jgi:hypothetical protein
MSDIVERRMVNNAHIVQGRVGERLVVCLIGEYIRFRLENDEGRFWYVDASHDHAHAIAHLINNAGQQAEQIKQEGDEESAQAAARAALGEKE